MYKNFFGPLVFEIPVGLIWLKIFFYRQICAQSIEQTTSDIFSHYDEARLVAGFRDTGRFSFCKNILLKAYNS